METETEIESGGNEIQAERRTNALLQYCNIAVPAILHIAVLIVVVAVVENH